MKKFFPLLIIPFLFILDRITKFMVVSSLKEGQSFLLWPGVFHLTRVNNTGAAFGMLKGSTLQLTIISLGCVIGIFVVLAKDFFVKPQSNFLKASFFYSLRNSALALIVAGAAGNLYDRIRYGYVIDFLDFRIWPVFNLADSSICVGIFLMILSIFGSKKAL